MGWIGGLLALVGAVAVVVLVNRRLRRYDREVDSYHEREFRDPPAFDGLDRLGGGGGF